MRNLAKLLFGALVSFQVLAIAQEWRLFASAWFGVGQRQEVPRLSPERRAAAEHALRQFYVALRHVHANPDPRFVDRLPATELVAQELLSDIVYLQHSGFSQRSTLMQLEVKSATANPAGSVALETRELWITQLVRLVDRIPAEAPRSSVLTGRYLLIEERGQWRVARWDVDLPTGSPGAASGGT